MTWTNPCSSMPAWVFQWKIQLPLCAPSSTQYSMCKSVKAWLNEYVAISLWEAPLNYNSTLLTSSMETAAHDESHVEHENRQGICGTGNEDLITKDMKSCLKNLSENSIFLYGWGVALKTFYTLQRIIPNWLLYLFSILSLKGNAGPAPCGHHQRSIAL